MGLPLSKVWKTCRRLFSMESCSCHIHFQHVAATSWLIGGDPVAIIDAEPLVTSVSPSTLLEAPLSKSGSWESQNLTRRSLPIELSMPVLTKFLWHNQGSVAPLADVPLENGRSLIFRLRVEGPCRTSGTLSSDPISFLSGSPSALMSAQCCSLPRRTSSESSCIPVTTYNPFRSFLRRTVLGTS